MKLIAWLSSDSSKKDVWFRDQYQNPHETKHTVGEVLGWFSENNLEPLACMPPVAFFEPPEKWTKLFIKRDWGSPLGRFFKQAGWVFSLGREGGLFVMTARKRKV